MFPIIVPSSEYECQGLRNPLDIGLSSRLDAAEVQELQDRV